MKIIVASILIAFMSLPIYAGFKTEMRKPQQFKASGNPITINNHTGIDIAYVMMGVYGGAVYGIKRGGSDVYYAGAGDNYATFEVGLCTNLVGESCNQSKSVKACNNTHYNADLIKTIDVNTLTSCVVTCLDDSETSCKQSG